MELTEETLIGPAVTWLNENNAGLQRLVDDTIKQRCNRSLPHDQRVQDATESSSASSLHGGPRSITAGTSKISFAAGGNGKWNSGPSNSP